MIAQTSIELPRWLRLSTLLVRFNYKKHSSSILPSEKYVDIDQPPTDIRVFRCGLNRLISQRAFNVPNVQYKYICSDLYGHKEVVMSTGRATFTSAVSLITVLTFNIHLRILLLSIHPFVSDDCFSRFDIYIHECVLQMRYPVCLNVC